MAKFTLARPAEKDLLEITDDLARDNVEAMSHISSRLERAMERLAEQPALGHRREDLTPLAFRFWPVFDDLIVYDPDAGPLAIVRVLRGRRDVRHELDPE